MKFLSYEFNWNKQVKKYKKGFQKSNRDVRNIEGWINKKAEIKAFKETGSKYKTIDNQFYFPEKGAVKYRVRLELKGGTHL